MIGETNYAPAERVAGFIAHEGLGDDIRMLGKVPYEHLPAWYRNAAAIVFASSCENCPNILLEALGSGRPVLSSDVAPMPEFGGVDLAYFSPYDADDISGELEKVLSDQGHANRLADAARERAAHYDWDRTAAATWSAIFDIADA